MEHGRVTVLVHLYLESLPETCIPRLESFEPMVMKLHSGQKMLYKNQSKGNHSTTEPGRVTVLVHCTFSHRQKLVYQIWSHLNLWWQSYTPDKEISMPPPPLTTKVIPICCLVRRHKNKQSMYEVPSQRFKNFALKQNLFFKDVLSEFNVTV